MKIIKILHFYPDIMNLYGEYGNIVLLKKHLENLGYQADIISVSFDDNANLDDYDFIYMGSGTERNQKVVLKDFIKYKDSLKKSAEEGKVMLFTGNAFELLGKSITDSEGMTFDALNLSDFETKEDNKKRITGDAYCECDFSERPIVGFINKCTKTTGVDKPLFEMKMGFGNFEENGTEGFRYKNVFATHLIGPVLVKNPHFMSYILKLLISFVGDECTGAKEYPFEESSYKITESELKLRMEELRKE